MAKLALDTPVQYIKGVGPRLARLCGKLGVATVADLLYFAPRSYEDRSRITPVGELRSGEESVIVGEIEAVDHQLTRGRFSVLKVAVRDRSGAVQAIWFNQPYLAKMLRRGMKLLLSGRLEFSDFDHSRQFQVRDWEPYTGANLSVVPVYPLTEGLYPKKIRSMLETALSEVLDGLDDWLPDNIRKKHQLAELAWSIRQLHFPEKLELVEPARRRLAFNEFFVFQLGLGLRKAKVKKEPGIAFRAEPAELDKFLAALPFQLTAAQQRVLAEIAADLRRPEPMNRLLQGDVGSGKTVVAAAAAYLAVREGYQAALMAPTEILAQQHFEKLGKLFALFKMKVELRTGTTARKSTVENRKSTIGLYVGTHALIQQTVGFDRLGLVIIDEQHRFGVLQRAELVGKGRNPDVLVMTATPIPRSLALTLYGDLERSVIDELPPGRTPVKTYFVPDEKRPGAYQFIRQKIKEGRQVFIVYPLVEESAKVDLKAAQAEAERLQKTEFSEFKVGLLHGRLKSEAKDRIMADFQAQKLQLLVSTTVIEVGIDIQNATVMVVEHAERFGLSQLHQLRGRIGRGAEESHCFLFAATKSPEAKQRIKAMLQTTDGFRLAEFDLKFRGPGDFYGTRQSGLPNFRVADIIKDENLLREARAAAFGLLAEDGERARNIWQSEGEKAQGAAAGATLN